MTEPKPHWVYSWIAAWLVVLIAVGVYAILGWPGISVAIVGTFLVRYAYARGKRDGS